jgi:hypothetical protein
MVVLIKEEIREKQISATAIEKIDPKTYTFSGIDRKDVSESDRGGYGKDKVKAHHLPSKSRSKLAIVTSYPAKNKKVGKAQSSR